MLKDSIHGVARVAVSATALDPVEFYGVFFRGVLQPTTFTSWAEAHAHFVKLGEVM